MVADDTKDDETKQAGAPAEEQLYKKLRRIEVDPRGLLLDPNNPRYQGESTNYTQVPFSEIAHPAVQDRAYQTMKQDRFEVRQLAESMAQVGYLPIDNIVLTRYGTNKYLVIEGNRRVTALKMILNGEVKHRLDDVNSLTRIPALVLEEPTEVAAITQWLIQGTRHIGGIKPWGPFQKARALDILMKQRGFTAREAAAALGLSKYEVTRLLRSLAAFAELREDPKYGRFAKADNFSFFDEMLGKPRLREYFKWNEKSRSFADPSQKAFFFRLVFGDADTNAKPKVKAALELRKVDKIIRRPVARASLESLDQPLEKAIYLSEDPTGGDSLMENLLQLEGQLSKLKQRADRLGPKEQSAMRRLLKLIERVLRKR